VNKDRQSQITHLGTVYKWFLRRLEAIGQLSNTEKDEEEMHMNPSNIEDMESKLRDKQTAKRTQLLDENHNEARSR